MLCGVPTPIVPFIKEVCEMSHPNVVRCRDLKWWRMVNKFYYIKICQMLIMGRGHRISKGVQVFKLWWGHRTGREQLGWGHRTTCKAEFQDFTTYPAGGWMAGWMAGWLGGPLLQEIMPLRGSILQVGTCQILSLAENPRWSRVL